MVEQETLKEAAEIDLTNLCHYDKRNPDCSVDDEDIEDHKNNLFKKNKTCSCDNCFYGRTKLTEQLIWQQERMYSEKDLREAFKGGGKMSWTDINQETLEEAAINYIKGDDLSTFSQRAFFMAGAKWQQEQDKNKYSDEDMISFAHFYFQEEFNSSIQTFKPTDEIFKEWFEQFEKK
jgi:hypothetical protein